MRTKKISRTWSENDLAASVHRHSRLKRKAPDIASSEITSKRVCLRRREFLDVAGVLTAAIFMGTDESLDAAQARRKLTATKKVVTTSEEEWPQAYGFYSNVNPKVDHPNHSQARERRIGEFFLRETLMFNGYENQVASLYAGEA